MAIRIIYDQTIPAIQNGETTGWIKVLDVTQLVAGCTGFIYDADSGPIAMRVEAIDAPNSKLQLSLVQPDGSYAIGSLVQYTVRSATNIKIPQQAREDAGYVPPGTGAIAGLVAGGSTVGSGFVTFANSNGVSFGLSNNVMTASAVGGGGGGGNLALSAGNYSTNSGTVQFLNSNGISFGMETDGNVTASYTVPDISQIQFSNSNNVTFGVSGWTVTASASFSQSAQTQGLVNIEGSTGSIHFGNANGISFGGSLNTITGSVVIPAQTVQTQNLVSIEGSTGNIFFDNANGLTFGGSNNTITASYTVPTVPAQTVQPVAASASNGSFLFSTLGFNNGGGVTFGSDVFGINATVKTDYQTSGAYLTTAMASDAGSLFQSANPNYLTSQSNQAISGSNGSFAFQTLSLGESNGLAFYTTNGSVVGSYTVPNVPAQTYQPVAVSGSNGSMTASTLSFGVSNNVTFYTTNGSIVASVPPNSPAIGISAGANSTVDTHFAFINSNNVSFGLATLNNEITASASFSQSNPGISGSNGSLSFQTVTFGASNGATFYTTNGSMVVSYTVPAIPGATVFSNSNNVSFTLNGSTVNASASFPAQSVQPVAVSGSNGSFAFSTLTMGNSNGLTFYTTNGSVVGSYTVPTVPGATVFSNSNNVTFGLNGSTITASVTVAATAQTVQPVAVSASNGSYNFSTLKLIQGGGVTWSTDSNGINATVKTDYQSSNANYLTSQSNQPVAVSASNGSYNFSTLKFVEGSGVTWATQANGIQASVKTDYQSSNANYLTSQSTGPSAIGVPGTTLTSGPIIFSNSNGVSFGYGTGTATNIITVTVQPGAAAGIAAINAGSEQATNGTVTFANSNGVTFGMGSGGSAGVITASIQPAAASGVGAIIAGTQTVSSGSVTFSNSNNISFGLGSGASASILTASAGFTQSTQPVAVSGSNGSFAFSTLTMGASNGLTFYTTNGSVVGSYTVPTIPGATVFSNSNNVSFTLNGSTVNASASFPAQTAQPVAVSASNGSYNFSTLKLIQGGGVTWSTDSNGVNATVKTDYQSSNANYLTSQSNQALSGSNGSFAFQSATFGASNGATFYTTNGSMVVSYTVPTIPGATVFSNSNNVSFTLNGSTVNASASYPAQTVQPVAASGSNGSFQFSTLSFGASNGATFYTTNNSVVVSYTVPTQSTQPVAASGSNGSFTFSTLTLGSSNGMHFYTTNGSVVGSYTVPTQTVQPVAASASNGSYNFSTLKFVEGSGVTWATQVNGIQASVKTDYQSSNANYLTSQTVQPVAASGSNGSFAFSTLTFGSSNNIHFYTTNNSIVASYAGGAAGGVAISADGTGAAGSNSQSSGTVQFANSNGITFGLSNNGVMTASVQAGAAAGVGAIAAGGSTMTSGTVAFGDANGMSFGFNGSTITGSNAFTVSAANGSYATNALVFPNTLGHTWSTGTQGVYLASDADPWMYTLRTYEPRMLASTTQRTLVNNQLWLVPFRITAPVSASSLMMIQSLTGSVSSATTGTYGQTIDLVIYSQHSTDPNRFDSMWSSQRTMSVMESATSSAGWAYNGAGSSVANSTVVVTQVFGLRENFWNINSQFDSGLYIFGFRQSTSSAQYSLIVHTASNGWVMNAPQPLAMGSGWGSATATSIGWVDAGTWTSATTASPPASVSIGHIAPVSNLMPWFKMGNL